MYLPRNLISHLYLQLSKSHHPLSPPVLILVALEPDALCACRILTSLLKRDYIPHKIHPIGGYADLTRAGQDLVKPMRLSEAGSGGVVVCLGVGGLVDLEALLGLEEDEEGNGGCDGVDIWVFDARRPWNLSNIFGGAAGGSQISQEQDSVVARKTVGVEKGEVQRTFRQGKGGIIVFDDGDIQEELTRQRDAWFALEDMPEVEDVGEDDDDDAASAVDEEPEDDGEVSSGRKRKSWSDQDEDEEGDDEEKENERPRQRRRSNSSSPIPSSPSSQAVLPSRRPSHPLQSTPPSNQLSSPVKQAPSQPSAKSLRRKFLKLRRKHEETIRAYYAMGTSYSEPISSLMYSLASELGRDDNDLLWLSIIGVSSTEVYGRTSTGVSLTDHDRVATTFTGWIGNRGSRIRQMLRDEVRRLNPPELTETGHEVTRGMATDAIPTHARSPTDTSIRLSPEPRFLLLRHWSLYDSMLHSPYLSAKLHIWSDAGRKRLAKLLAKMGVSLVQCKQSYTHMDMDLKKDLRQKLLTVAPMYGLDGLVPPPSSTHGGHDKEGWGFVRCWGWKACLSAADVAVIIGAILEVGTHVLGTSSHTSNGQLPTPRHSPSASTASSADASTAAEEALERFYSAYDALLSPTALTQNIPLAQSLHRAILRTGTSILQKRQLRNLRAFRMALVKEGPDVALFTNPGALMKLALWVGEAVKQVDKDDGKSRRKTQGGMPLVLGCVNEARGVYVVVGLGGGGGGGGGGGASARSKEEREEKEKKRKEKEVAREKRREERRAARRRARADRGGDGEDDVEDEEEVETEDESEASSGSDTSDEEPGDEGSTKRVVSRNRFGNAFQEVVEETSARVRLDSFEHCVVEVKKEDLSGFLESLSMKAVVG